ncbi:hypothetical protein EMIT053CA3_20232 [Pseudomonas donghuensis]
MLAACRLQLIAYAPCEDGLTTRRVTIPGTAPSLDGDSACPGSSCFSPACSKSAGPSV